MDAIKEFLELDFTGIILTIFLIMAACIAIYDIIGKFSVIIGKPVKKYRQREIDHNLVVENAKAIKELAERHEHDKEQSILHDKRIDDKLDELTKLFIDKEVEDMRYTILDFASAISLGRNYTKEQYMHTIRITDKYHRIIKERNLENGQAEISTKIIKDSFEEKMRNGSF